jgi:hypothetical protein
LLVKVTAQLQWSLKTALAAFIASLLPFGMLYAEFKIFRSAKQT